MKEKKEKKTVKTPKAPQKSEMQLKFEDIEARMEAVKYEQQAYAPDSQVTMPGSLFVDFIQQFGKMRAFLGKVESITNSLTVASNESLLQSIETSYDLMEQHMQNVDLGVTYTIKQEQEQDGEVKPSTEQ